MKQLSVLIFAAAMVLFGGNIASAQDKYGPNRDECIKYLSYYTEYYKQKSYDEATPNWRKAFEICPHDSRESILVDGTTLVRRLITKNAANSIYKSALVDTLMMLHDLRAENFPKSVSKALNNKGKDMTNYLKDDDKALYAGLSDIVAKLGTETTPSFFVFLMQTSISLYEKGVKDTEEVINEYEKAVELLDSVSPQTEDIVKVKGDVENLFISSKIADCEKLIELFSPRLAANPDSYDTAATIARILSITEGCTDNDLFVNATLTMHNLQPSHKSAYLLYRLYSSRGEYDDAAKMMMEAINSDETDADTDAAYYLELAIMYNKNGKAPKAVECGLSAAKLDTDGDVAGKAYMLVGQVWGGTVCQGNEIEQRAPYWVAVDYMNKAKAADSSLASDCDSYIASYKKYYPATADAFMYDITDGQSYTVSCGGMTATTTVKTQK